MSNEPRAAAPTLAERGVAPPARYLDFEHVLLAMPDGEERRAREFYVDVLGFTEVVRPESLGGRGGGWFRAGPVMLHLGVERDFHAARMAHPAIIVDSLGVFVARCESLGCPIEPAVKLPGFERVHVYDPFGNRLEFMERVDDA
ncbi:MAG TPA: VOC family protein [Gemmatimonadaceae bacterium]|nr:VOC family protein [Gemmatimonadaceae bacterium]